MKNMTRDRLARARLAFAALTAGAALLGAGGCGKADRTETIQETRTHSVADLDARTTAAIRDFGLRLYGELASAEPDRNVWLSPLSVSSALSAAYAGAAGETAGAMAGTLGFGGMDADAAGNGYRVLLDLLNHPTDDGVSQTVANSLWLRKGFGYRESYAEVARSDFDAEVDELDFAKEQAALKRMNDWVKDKTNGRIPEIVRQVDPNARFFILNAVSYNAVWTRPFNEESTEDAAFHAPGGDVEAAMMKQTGTFEYADTPLYEGIRLPLGRQASASFVVLLPKPDVPLAKLREELVRDPGPLTADWESRIGSIELPRIHLDFDGELKRPLTAMGMGTAFDPGSASFAGIAPEPPNLYIGQVLHKTTLDVNEAGVEAAAATDVEGLAGAAPPKEPFAMTVDRPFIAAIQDTETGALLFVGTIVDPNGD